MVSDVEFNNQIAKYRDGKRYYNSLSVDDDVLVILIPNNEQRLIDCYRSKYPLLLKKLNKNKALLVTSASTGISSWEGNDVIIVDEQTISALMLYVGKDRCKGIILSLHQPEGRMYEKLEKEYGIDLELILEQTIFL